MSTNKGGIKYAESPYMASFVKAALVSFAGGLGIEKYPFMIYACRSYEYFGGI
jgi:hypothetical protein